MFQNKKIFVVGELLKDLKTSLGIAEDNKIGR